MERKVRNHERQEIRLFRIPYGNRPVCPLEWQLRTGASSKWENQKYTKGNETALVTEGTAFLLMSDCRSICESSLPDCHICILTNANWKEPLASVFAFVSLIEQEYTRRMKIFDREYFSSYSIFGFWNTFVKEQWMETEGCVPHTWSPPIRQFFSVSLSTSYPLSSFAIPLSHIFYLPCLSCPL